MFHNQFLEYVPADIRGGVLLEGPKGLFQYEDALLLAEKVLGGDAAGHPDAVIIRAEGKPITVDTIAQLAEKLSLMPARANRRCIIIEGAERIMPAAQNKLLMSLEEAEAFFILIAYGDVLGTIRSRLMPVSYRPMSEAEFVNATGKDGSAYFVTGGCPQLLDKDLAYIFEKTGGALMDGDPKGVMSCLGLVKEKDKNSFYEVRREYVAALFCYLGKCLMESGKRFEKISQAADAALRSTRATVYTSADFFKDIVRLTVDN